MAKRTSKRKTEIVSIATMSQSADDPNFAVKVLQREFSKASDDDKPGYFGSIYDVFFRLIFGDPELAAEFMKTYALDFAEIYDFEQTKLLPNEIVSKALAKRVADLIVQAPKKNAPNDAATISVIVEHKAQSGEAEDVHTVAQTVNYMTSTMLTQLNKDRNAKPRVFGFVVYTGPDKTLDSMSLEKVLPLGEDEKKLARYSMRCELFFVNLTKLYATKRLVGSPLLLAALRALGSAGNQTLDKDFEYVVEPLRDVDWKDPRNFSFFQSLRFFLVMYMRNHGKEFDNEFLDNAGKNAIPEEVRYKMKTFIDDIREEGRVEGREEGRVEGRAEGREEGRVEGKLEVLSKGLGRYGERARELQERIMKITSPDILDAIINLMFEVTSFKKLEQQVVALLATSAR